MDGLIRPATGSAALDADAIRGIIERLRPVRDRAAFAENGEAILSQAMDCVPPQLLASSEVDGPYWLAPSVMPRETPPPPIVAVVDSITAIGETEKMRT